MTKKRTPAATSVYGSPVFEYVAYIDQKYALKAPRETKVSIVGWKMLRIAAR
jgi:hypothetical protein